MDPQIAVCPYNHSHLIAKHKIIPHLKKCQDALRDKRKTIYCKNDLSIVFLENDQEYHFSICNFCRPNTNNDSMSNLNSSSFLSLYRVNQNDDEDDVKDKEWLVSITEPEIDLNNTTNFTQTNLMSSVPMSHTNNAHINNLDGSIWLDQSILLEMDKPQLEKSSVDKEESQFY
jgi:hypothetical protein